MNKDLSLINVVRLQTELEDAIAQRDYYLNHAQLTGNNIMFEYWDTTLDCIVNEIVELGV